MSNVVKLFPCTDIPATLRKIADQIENYEYREVCDCTLLFNHEVFHLGESDEYLSALQAMLNMQLGMRKLLDAVTPQPNN